MSTNATPFPLTLSRRVALATLIQQAENTADFLASLLNVTPAISAVDFLTNNGEEIEERLREAIHAARLAEGEILSPGDSAQIAANLDAARLDVERLAAADAFYEANQFPAGYEVTGADSWTRDGVYWSRWVYLSPEIAGQDGMENMRLSFGVEFAPGTAQIVDSWEQR